MNSHPFLTRRAAVGRWAPVALLSAAAAVSFSNHARAEEPSFGSSGAQSDKIKEANARFERGLSLFDDGDYDAALVEFNRAYTLAPTYKILYNIAKIERARNDYSAALTHFQRYLTEGGAEVPDERRAEVEREIGVLKERVAQVSITANVPGAAVYIDDIPVCGARMVDPSCVGTTPLKAPVVVNPGTRKITATKRGYQNGTAQITVAGGDKNLVRLELFDLKPPEEDTGPRTRAIVSWSITGALAVGAGVMGVIALDKKKDYDSALDKTQCQNQVINSNDCNRDTAKTLDSDKKSAKNFALVSDILTGAAVVGGVVSIYLTVKAANHETEPERAAQLRLRTLKVSAAPGGAFLSGTF